MPVTVATHAAVCPVTIDEGVEITLIPVTVTAGGAAVTVIFADPDTFVYPACVELAVQVPVPAPDGVNTPPEVIVPPVAVQVTAELYAPVPVTVAEQAAVCPVKMADGVGVTVTLVTVG